MKDKSQSGTSQVAQEVAKVGTGVFQFPYLVFKAQSMPKITTHPREGGVGSTFKSTTTTLGREFRENGVTHADTFYPFQVVTHTTFRFWPDLLITSRGIPLVASPSYASWYQDLVNKKSARFKNVHVEDWQRTIDESGMIERALMVATAFNTQLHRFIHWNSTISPLTYLGYNGIVVNDIDDANFAAGKTLSKNGMGQALYDLSDEYSQLSPETQEMLKYAYKPLVGVYETQFKRELIRIGINGVGDIHTRDIFTMRAGTEACVNFRTDHGTHGLVDGVVSLIDLMRELERLAEAIKPIWERVLEIFKFFGTIFNHVSNVGYLADLADFKFNIKPIDEDIYYAMTPQLAVHDANGGVELDWRTQNEVDPVNGRQILNLFWTGHPYRPGSYPILKALEFEPVLTPALGDPEHLTEWRVVYPLSICANGGDYLGHNYAHDHIVNVFYICWPHEPLTATPSLRTRFTMELINADDHMEVGRMVNVLSPLTSAFLKRALLRLDGNSEYYTSLAAIAQADFGFVGQDIADALMDLYPFVRYCNMGTRPLQEYNDIRMIEWINAYFDKEDVIPSVYYHVTKPIKESFSKNKAYFNDSSKEETKDKKVKKGPFKDDARAVDAVENRAQVDPENIKSQMEKGGLEQPERKVPTPEEKRKPVDKSKKVFNKGSGAKKSGFIPPDKWKAMTPEERTKVIAARKGGK